MLKLRKMSFGGMRMSFCVVTLTDLCLFSFCIALYISLSLFEFCEEVLVQGLFWNVLQ
jgi:hypothetical protein